MENIETINSTLNTFLSVCQVLLCYVIPLILVIWTALTFTKLFDKWENAVYSAKDGFVKAAEATMNAITGFFGLFAKKWAKWIMLAITLVYIVCVILYFIYR